MRDAHVSGAAYGPAAEREPASLTPQEAMEAGEVPRRALAQVVVGDGLERLEPRAGVGGIGDAWGVQEHAPQGRRASAFAQRGHVLGRAQARQQLGRRGLRSATHDEDASGLGHAAAQPPWRVELGDQEHEVISLATILEPG